MTYVGVLFLPDSSPFQGIYLVHHAPSLSRKGFTQPWKASLVHYCFSALPYSMEMAAVNQGEGSNPSQQAFMGASTTHCQLHPRSQHILLNKFGSAGTQAVSAMAPTQGTQRADCSKFLWRDLQVPVFSQSFSGDFLMFLITAYPLLGWVFSKAAYTPGTLSTKTTFQAIHFDMTHLMRLFWCFKIHKIKVKSLFFFLKIFLHNKKMCSTYPWSLLHPWVLPSFWHPHHCSNISWGSFQTDDGFTCWLAIFKRQKFNGLCFRLYWNASNLKWLD